jgi:formylglycine-generating enzyme
MTDEPFDGSILGTTAVFRWIRPGTFQMGSTAEIDPERYSDETPRTVTLTKGFWLLDHEVTQREYQSIKGTNPSQFKGENRPVERVSWNDAVDFCTRLTAKDQGEGRIARNQVYRLPTEAEWEYACRARTVTAVYYKDVDRKRELDVIAWWLGNSGNETHLVKGKRKNEFGLYDMIGNVWEWCSDWHGDYDPKSVMDPKGPPSGTVRVARGGSWDAGPRNSRSARRVWFIPGNLSNNVGFRPVLSTIQ